LRYENAHITVLGE